MPQNVTIQGATYNDVPSVVLPKDGGGDAKFYGDIIVGAMRPDAQLVKTWSYDKKIVDDEGVTIGAYSTSAKTLLASQTLSDDTYTYSYSTHNAYLVIRMLAIPEYNVTTNAKGRVEYWESCCTYEFTDVPANTFKSILNPDHKYASRHIATISSGNCPKLIYYSAANTITPYGTASYGVYETVTAPSVSSGKVTFKSPAFGIRGHATYLTSTYYNAITDIRYQYVADLYLAPKGGMNYDGFDISQSLVNIANDVNSNNGKLR